MSTPVEITWLLAAVAKGDAVAFERLYGATCAKLYGVVLRILRRHDLAADVMEQAYLRVWRGALEFDPASGAPLAWMVAIARRLAIDAARRPLPPSTAGEPEVVGTVCRDDPARDAGLGTQPDGLQRTALDQLASRQAGGEAEEVLDARARAGLAADADRVEDERVETL